MQHILFTIFLLHFALYNVYGQDKRVQQMAFAEGANIQISEIESYPNASWTITTGAAIHKGKQAEDLLLESYWTVSNLNDYNKLFIPGQAPKLAETDFRNWKNHVKTIVVTGKAKVTVGSKEFYLYQYYVQGQKGLSAVTRPFVAKKYGGVYFPCSYAELKKMHYFLNRLALVSFEGLEIIFSTKDKRGIQKELKAVRASCLKNNILQAECLYQTIANYIQNEKNDSSTDLFIRQVTPLKDFDTQKARSPELAAKDKQFSDYLTTLGVSPDVIRQVLIHIKKEQFTTVPILIAKALKKESSREYTLKIREIYGKDTIKIWNSLTQDWE